ncbi:Alpha/beta hydrolase family protein [Jannaschia seosinensis]|uniref:Alpha/beta hydrolase family protein n=1 Tax=Jannaschia seosinensis TaxID=313367 RepID=A0A0M7B5V7_9RHOB|nr:alpha/beta hydrolase [Jannaschia seosinensis]CUH30932.1 Alpha/beta hydrolase family protein [Jannaschia seosinensis]
MATYVLVHGAWHDGSLLADVAGHLRGDGWDVHTPTVRGNGADAEPGVGLEEAIGSIADYLAGHDLSDVVLAGHSHGGMIISGVYDRMPDRVKRLVYWNAFVPHDGESLIDLVPAHMGAIFRKRAEASEDMRFSPTYPVWRDVFFNDGDGAAAQAAYDRLCPQPYATFADKIALKTPPAAWKVGKSYINSLMDTAMPHSTGWHPNMSERLGMFRLIQMMGGHETCFTDPEGTARALHMAGRD